MPTRRRAHGVLWAGVIALSGVILPQAAQAEDSTATVQVPYGGSASVELPMGWTVLECPVGNLPDAIDVTCEQSRVTFTAFDYSPDIGTQDVTIAALSPQGSRKTTTYSLALASPKLSPPVGREYGYPLGQGTRVTIPFAELPYVCDACIENGPTFFGVTVDPVGAGTARFTGLGVEFAAAPDYIGDVNMGFAVRDRFGQETEPTTLVLTVVPGLSQAPIAVADFVRTVADEPAAGRCLDNDVGDVTGAEVISCGKPANGTVECSPDGSFTYTPFPGFQGVDQFAYHAVSGRTGDQSVGTVVVGVEADPRAVLEQEPGAEVAPMYAPPGEPPEGVLPPGVFAALQDAADAIPRG